MVSKSSSNRSTVNNAYDQRTFIDDRDVTNYKIDNRAYYDIDNSVRNEYDIDNSVRNEYDIDNRVYNDIDQSQDNRIIDSYNTTLGDGAVYAAQGDVSIVNNTTDHGAIEAALEFADDAGERSIEAQQSTIAAALEFAEGVQENATALGKEALQEAFKSTVGGLEEQQQKWMAGVSAVAVAAVAFTAFVRK